MCLSVAIGGSVALAENFLIKIKIISKRGAFQ
jgi:hypothetical protein